MRRLSHSQVRTYLRCPQQWKQKYVDGRPEKPKPFFNLGKAVHEALEVFYRDRISSPAPVEEMLEAFEEAFDPQAYETEEERERRRADGIKMIREFHAKHARDFEPALAVEKKCFFEFDGIPFVSVLDRIDKLNDDAVRVVDYKTGGRLDAERARSDPQLTLYQVAAEEKLGMRVESVALYHVPTQTPFEVERHGEKRVEELRSRVRRAARGIRDEAFEPDPGSYCEWCDFKPWCPAFAHEYPENWEQEPSPPAPSHDEAARLADRYGRLKEESRELEDEISEIRADLERFFEATGERTVAGEDFVVSANRSVGYRFDDEELRALLEPEGEWQRVLRPDWRAQDALLDDPSLPEDLRERIRELAREKVIWRLRVDDAAREPPEGAGAA